MGDLTDYRNPAIWVVLLLGLCVASVNFNRNLDHFTTPYTTQQ